MYILMSIIIKSAVFHPTFLTCGFYSVVLKIFSIHCRHSLPERLSQASTMAQPLGDGLPRFNAPSNSLKRVTVGKPKETAMSWRVFKSPKCPEQKSGITTFLKTGDLDGLRLSFLTWTEIKESQVMQSRRWLVIKSSYLQ